MREVTAAATATRLGSMDQVGVLVVTAARFGGTIVAPLTVTLLGVVVDRGTATVEQRVSATAAAVVVFSTLRLVTKRDTRAM